ncbi:hypothetical protein GTZ78_53810, partial [Streptomyces sp. SID8361]|nr:hypothetical protein [Streptomyces sp. SID8361]
AVERGDLGSFGIDTEQPLSAALPALASWRRARQEQSVIDGWRYRLSWTPIPAVSGESGRLTGTWLLVVEPGGGADDLVGAMRAAGAEVRTVTVAEVAEAARLGAPETVPATAGVVSMLPVEETVAVLQTLRTTAPLWCVTRGAVSV